MVHGYSDLTQEAAQNQMSYTDFLEKILTTEIRERQSRSQTMLTKLARIFHVFLFISLKNSERVEFLGHLRWKTENTICNFYLSV